MAAHDAASDWSGDRGRQWLANVDRMEAMLAPVDEPLLQALALEGGQRIAEIGCGGGATARGIADLDLPGLEVRGVDISADLVEAARRRAVDIGNLRFVRADAGTDQPPEGPFDRLTSRFGVMFFSEPPRAFNNLARWLRPGGRIALAVWGPMASNPWMTCVRDSVAAVIDIPRPEPDAPGPFRYADSEKLLGLLRGAGFSALRADSWEGSLALGGGLRPEDAASFALSAFAFAEPLAELPREYARAHTQLSEVFRQHTHGDRVVMPAMAHIVTGWRQ